MPGIGAWRGEVICFPIRNERKTECLLELSLFSSPTAHGTRSVSVDHKFNTNLAGRRFADLDCPNPWDVGHKHVRCDGRWDLLPAIHGETHHRSRGCRTVKA